VLNDNHFVKNTDVCQIDEDQHLE